MKLFGGSGSQKHISESRRRNKYKPDKAPAGEKRPPVYVKFFHAPIWRKLRTPLIVLGCIVLFLLAVLLIYSIWEKPPGTLDTGPNMPLSTKPAVTDALDSLQDNQNYNPPIIEETQLPEETTVPTMEPTVTGRKEDCYTFVILACDQLKANTDTILVGRMDVADGTLDLVSIPRDTLVNVSWGVKKINSILSSERNDPERFLMHLGNLIGYTVDCYAVVDIRSVEKLVDCIGGVYYNVPRDMEYDDPAQDLHIHIPKGYRLLLGKEAVDVLRFRMGNDGSGYVNGDLGRIQTQQDFLATMAAQFLNIWNIPNLTNAIEIVETYVQTNMDASNMAFLAREFLKMDKENVRFHTLPGTGVSIRGGSYYAVNIEEWLGIVNEYLNPYLQIITADNLNILQCSADGGAVSTTGEVLPVTSFYDFSQYVG